jgi:hypothetical protein
MPDLSLGLSQRLRPIGVGRAHTGKRVKLLIADDHVRVVGPDGLLLRDFVLDPAPDYQPRLHSVHDVVREDNGPPDRCRERVSNLRDPDRGSG